MLGYLYLEMGPKSIREIFDALTDSSDFSNTEGVRKCLVWLHNYGLVTRLEDKYQITAIGQHAYRHALQIEESTSLREAYEILRSEPHPR